MIVLLQLHRVAVRSVEQGDIISLSHTELRCRRSDCCLLYIIIFMYSLFSFFNQSIFDNSVLINLTDEVSMI